MREMTATTVVGRADEVRAGMSVMLPIVAGLVPFGLVLGATIADHGSPLAAWSGTLPIFGGSAHLTVIQVLDQGSGAPLAIATGLLIHARLVVYSASLADGWRDQPRWFRAVGAAVLIDQTWALAQQRATGPGSAGDHRRHYLAGAVTLGAGWLAIVTTGVVLGPRLGPLGLDLAAPLCLITLAAPRLTEKADWVVAASAGAVAAVAGGLPAGTGLLVAIVAGTGAGALMDGRPR
jgi:predicted branched-subunit amino acid permease